MTDPTPTRRFRPTPAWLICGLLVIEGLLWLSDRFQWPTWHKGYAVLISVAAVGLVFVVMLLWLIVALVFRLRFQFSILSLLVLTVAVALACSWLAVEMKAAREQGVLVNEFKSGGVKVQYDWEFDAGGNPLLTARPSGPAWLRTLLRDDFFSDVSDMSFGTDATDKSLEHLDGLTQLRCLFLGSTQVTDKGLEHLTGLTQIQTLWLSDTQVTDKGLEHLTGLTKLRTLASRLPRSRDWNT